MEEGGHYYTVYYTSIAVGFKEEIAYRHAVLAQMPDEVGRMDAANMQIKEGTGFRETDFNNINRYVPVNERYAVQYGLHSLPGNHLSRQEQSSAYQRSYTTTKLMQEDAGSLKFGLLLHRLGDSYAHSRIGNEAVMYAVTPKSSANIGNMGYGRNDYGHLSDGHDPDFAFLRPALFYSYLQNLYTVLSGKLNERDSIEYKRENFAARPFHSVRADFTDIFASISSKAKKYNEEAIRVASRTAGARGGGSLPRLASNDLKGKWMIEGIRLSADRILHTPLRAYTPEKEDAMSLNEFLKKRKDFSNRDINNENLVNAIEGMVPGGGKGLLSPPPIPEIEPQLYIGP
jgi:hypothetical protein